MKQHLLPALLITAVCSLTLSSLRAGPAEASDVTTTSVTPANNTSLSQEFLLETSYTGRSEMKQGDAKIGGVGDLNSQVNYVISPQVSDSVLLRFGGNWERNSFDLPASAPLPNTLQSTNLIIGADMTLSDKIILRAELHPGLYSDFVNITGSDFDMPVQIGGTYLWSKDFQIIMGLQIDLKSNLPIIGLPGVRWQFADKWVLSAIPPKPQLQYLFNNNLTLYVGSELLGGTYHLNDSFGSTHGHGPGSTASQLNGNIVDFTEVRIGAGVTWKFTPNMSLDVSAGYVPYREFDIHADKIGFDTDSTEFHNSIGDGAPYGEVGISGSF